MKKINFLHTLSPQEQSLLIQWYRISFFLLVTVLVFIMIAEGKQIRRLYNHWNEYQRLHIKNNQYKNHIVQEKELKNELQQLHQQIIATNNAQQSLQTVCNYLESVIRTVPVNLIENINITDDHISIQLITPSTEIAINLIQQLAQEQPFNKPSLQSIISQSDEKVMSTILYKRTGHNDKTAK